MAFDAGALQPGGGRGAAPRARLVLFRNGHDFDACCQLLNTIFGGGAGLVPLPHAVRMLGPRAALPVIVACGAFSFYTSQAIVIASCLVGEATYQGVARRTLGHIGAEVVRLLLIVLAFSTGVAGLSIFADVAQILLVGWCTRTACLFIAGCIVTPLVVCIRDIERLAVISVAVAGLLLLFLLYAIVEYFGAPSSVQGLAQIPHHGDRRTLAEALNAASVIHLSFNCHFNVLPLFYALPAHDTGLSSSPREHFKGMGGEALRQQQRRMRRVIGTATVLALGVYVTIGWLGYMAFGRRPSGNTFADYATRGFVLRTTLLAVSSCGLRYSRFRRCLDQSRACRCPTRHAATGRTRGSAGIRGPPRGHSRQGRRE